MKQIAITILCVTAFGITESKAQQPKGLRSFEQKIEVQQQSISSRLYGVENRNMSSHVHPISIYQYNDSLFVLVDDQARFLGKVKKEKEVFVRDGEGIERVRVNDKGPGGSTRPQPDPIYEYYIGQWQENFKHGKGFFIDYSGKAFAGIWKNGYVKSKSIRELTPSEKEYVDTMVNSVNNLQFK